VPLGRPEYLRQQCETSLRRLDLERIDLFQLHRIDPRVPADEQFGLMRDLQREGKIRHVGLSEVGVAEIEAAQRIVPIVSVQNRYNVSDRTAEGVLDHCTAHGIGFIPWFPIGSGAVMQAGGAVAEVAKTAGVSASQVALAWLLRRSPVALPIPGTASVAHLEDNCGAAALTLTGDQFARLSAAAS
jgi:pyridoxine 4-dehydrogenase